MFMVGRERGAFQADKSSALFRTKRLDISESVGRTRVDSKGDRAAGAEHAPVLVENATRLGFLYGRPYV